MDPRSLQVTDVFIVHVTILLIHVQFSEGVEEIHQERLPEWIEELIVNAPVPHSMELIEDLLAPQEQLIVQETT